MNVTLKMISKNNTFSLDNIQIAEEIMKHIAHVENKDYNDLIQ